MTHLYNGLVDRMAKSFDSAFSAIEAVYNTEYGTEFEVALCRAIGRLLPSRFSICRGFVVTRDGQTGGDDIIIYERHLFPTARFLLDDDFSLKEQVPVEAVAAYIEAKHTFDLVDDSDSSLSKALRQIDAVKRMCDQREPVPLNRVARNSTVDGFPVRGLDGYPDRRNPSFTAIFSRNVREKKGKDYITDSAVIGPALGARGQVAGLAPPDLVVAGSSVVALPCIQNVIKSPFMPREGGTLTVMPADNVAFAIGICDLLWALDYIELGNIPWTAVMAEALKIPFTGVSGAPAQSAPSPTQTGR